MQSKNACFPSKYYDHFRGVIPLGKPFSLIENTKNRKELILMSVLWNALPSSL